MKQILAFSHVRKSYDGKVVLDDVTLAFLPGAKIGVVGPNGMGKSTLLRMMAGMEQPPNGEVRLMPGYSVGILPQEPVLDECETVLGNVAEGVAVTRALAERYNQIAARMAADYSDELLEEMGQLQEQLDHQDAWDLDSRVKQAMEALRCPPPDAEVSQLSGGERRRVALCRLLLSQPDLLLLDEPTNHLDAESVAWLEQHLGAYPGTVVAVTHDRYFLDDVAGWILELDRGHAYPYEGNYSTYLETKAARMTVEGQRDAKLRRRLERELAWVRSSPRARQAKGQARLERYEQMAAAAASRTKLDFEEIQIPPGPPSLTFSCTDLRDTCLELASPGRVTGNDVQGDEKSLVIVTGANSGGKSTFLRSVGVAQLMMQCGLFVTAQSYQATVARRIFTHFIREEDAGMTSGRLDDELRRMSGTAGQIAPGCLMLFNESFAGTNEREGSEIACQIVRALLDAQIKVFFVTHRYGFADHFRRQHAPATLFLRAERQPDGSRNYKLTVKDPLPTSYGEDLYYRLGGWLDEDKAPTPG
jgi:ATPase subunit of ABC transporter with duplicated ATPase domains